MLSDDCSTKIRLRPVQIDGPAGLADHAAVEIEYACARFGAHIYANKIAAIVIFSSGFRILQRDKQDQHAAPQGHGQ